MIGSRWLTAWLPHADPRDYISAPEAVFEKVGIAIDQFQMLADGERVVIGVSGGQDSVTLLHILWRLSAHRHWKLAVAHLNHCLRGADADEDERFVRNLSERLSLPCFCERVSVRDLAREEKISLAQAGRLARLRFFSRILSATDSNKVALAHTATDAVESLLLNLFRGSGWDGLKGIPPVSPLTFPNGPSGWIVRPLILTWREETELYCQVHRLSPRLDISNLDPSHPRNWIRHHLIPTIRQRFPQAPQNLFRFCQIAWETTELLENLARSELQKITAEASHGHLSVRRSEFVSRPRPLQRLLLKEMVGRLTGALPGVTFLHSDAALNLVGKHHGHAQIDLPGRLTLKVEKGFVILEKSDSGELA